jgi:nucleoside-diphosphate-sugar epimerase
MKVLIIGGTGNISWHVTNQSVLAGHETWIMNREKTSFTCKRRKLSSGRNVIWVSDVNNLVKFRDEFDVIVDFLCYTPEQAKQRIKLFKGWADQYIFISSTAVYQKPTGKLPYTEESPTGNVFWKYAQDKLEAEDVFLKSKGFPITIVRPGHTYDTIIPYAVGQNDWTIAQRILDGKEVILHGDGTTLWTLTHSHDFAKGLVGLFGNPASIGEIFHITSDEWRTWVEIMARIAEALGKKILNASCVPSGEIYNRNHYIGDGIIGHKMWCDIYDNSKIKEFVPNWSAKIPFSEGIKSTIDWYLEDKNRQVVDKKFDKLIDELLEG